MDRTAIGQWRHWAETVHLLESASSEQVATQ